MNLKKKKKKKKKFVIDNRDLDHIKCKLHSKESYKNHCYKKLRTQYLAKTYFYTSKANCYSLPRMYLQRNAETYSSCFWIFLSNLRSKRNVTELLQKLG